MIYDCIIIGGGASGLFAASLLKVNNGLILEKGKATGTKLLMSGGGQCNITHGGSIKSFIDKYGDKGKKIRSCLYKNNNQSLISHIETLGVPLFERDDGKVFPVSLSAMDIRDVLTATAAVNGFEIMTRIAVTNLCYVEIPPDSRFSLNCENGNYNLARLVQITAEKKDVNDIEQKIYLAKTVIIATGGASYPATGSDGGFFDVMASFKEDAEIVTPRPSLVPVCVENYPFSELSGISFPETKLTISKRARICTCDGKHDSHIASDKPIVREGSLLLTHKNFSGPLILDASRYIEPGDKLSFNFCSSVSFESLLGVLKKDSINSQKGTPAFIAEVFNSLGITMPQRFINTVLFRLSTIANSNNSYGIGEKKARDLSKKELQLIARDFTEMTFTVSGLGSFKEAMSTAGGLSLSEIDIKTMEWMPDVYVIGEALDVDGDTGGYNLQFAYSSAATAAEHISDHM